MMLLYGEEGWAGGPRGRRGGGGEPSGPGVGAGGAEGAGRRGRGFIVQLTLSDPFQRSDQTRSDQV